MCVLLKKAEKNQRRNDDIYNNKKKKKITDLQSVVAVCSIQSYQVQMFRIGARESCICVYLSCVGLYRTFYILSARRDIRRSTLQVFFFLLIK